MIIDINTKLQAEIIQFFRDSKYDTFYKHSVLYVWLHQGNGINYRVVYYFHIHEMNIFKYHTKGYININIDVKGINNIFLIKSHLEAERIFHS